MAQRDPRRWSPDDVIVLHETADRVWAAAAHAHSEAALRASEEKYRALFNQMDEAYAVVEVIADGEGRWSDFRFIEVNPAFHAAHGHAIPRRSHGDTTAGHTEPTLGRALRSRGRNG